MKLEKNLKVLHFGKGIDYFKTGKTHTYDNKGTRSWDLKVSNFKYGAFADEKTASTKTSTEGVAVTNAVHGFLDLSSKFITVSET